MKKIISISLVLLVLPVFAAEYRCPESIESIQTIPKVPQGWQTYNDPWNGSQKFENVLMFDGHPNDNASLVPDTETKPYQDSTWTNHTAKGFWLACYYNQSTVRLIQAIPKSVKKCTLKFKGKKIDYLSCV
jgi:hypothetical protein